MTCWSHGSKTPNRSLDGSAGRVTTPPSHASSRQRSITFYRVLQMSSSSFISSSRPVSPARRFLRELSLFLLPLTVIAILGTGIALLCGELLPVRVVAWLQTREKPFVFMPQLSDHTYRFKLEVILRRRPETLALGSSRANQWRSAMFRPTDFYNAANAIFAVRDFHRMLEEFGDFTPRV